LRCWKLHLLYNELVIEKYTTNNVIKYTTKVFNINFFSVVDVVKSVLPQMRKQKNGLIINITSVAGYMGLPFRGIYSETKGALELATEAMRMEVKEFGIKVTNVAPRRYHTPVFKDSPYKTLIKVISI